MDISSLIQSAVSKVRDTANNLFAPNNIVDKSTGVPSFLGNALASGQTLLGSAESALSQFQPLPYSVRDYLGTSAQTNLNNALSTRQKTGTMGSFDQGFGSGLNTTFNVAGPAIKTGLTAAGSARMLAQPLLSNAINLGVGSAIGGGLNKLTGGSFQEGAIGGALSTPLYTGAGELGGKLLGPVMSKINPNQVESIKPYLNLLNNPEVSDATKSTVRNLLFKNASRNILASGLEAGTGNAIVGATEKANNLQERLANTGQAFGTGALFGAGTKALGYGVEGVVNSLNRTPSPEELNRMRGSIQFGKSKIHPEDLNEMKDFVDYTSKTWKPFDKYTYEASIRDLAQHYGINPEQPNYKIASTFKRILNQEWSSQSGHADFIGGQEVQPSGIKIKGKVGTNVELPNTQVQNNPLVEGTNIPNSGEQVAPNYVLSDKQGIQQPKVSTESPNALTQPILALPAGEPKQYVVKTKTQLKKVLAENPNANVRIELKPENGKLVTYGSIPDRVDVAATIPQKVDNFIQNSLGYSPENPGGGNKGANFWTKGFRKVQEGVSTKVEQGLVSDNPLIRNAANTMQNFFRGLGMSPERAQASAELRGGMASAQDRAYNVMESLYSSLKNNKQSLERINAVLDPEIAKTKVTFNDLNKNEKAAYGLIRQGFDLVHDISYANGHISPELYASNKGRYVPRLYEVTELPPEVNKFVTQGKKIDNNLYKQRGSVTDWKVENSLNDPVYALGKRLAQVETNRSIKQYTDWLSGTGMVSDVERPGFIKLSDSPAYGQLAGKYVLNSAAEDLKGFFFSNQGLQNLYDAFRAYDRMGIRQLQKKMLTVFNPTTNVGNIVSDNVFGFMTGVDPFTLNKNIVKLKSNPSEFKQLADYLTREGVLGTDITRSDFVNRMGKIDELASGKTPNLLTKISDKAQSFYGGTDDVYKLSAFKALLDKGFTLQEATRRVAEGFQNYANVGKFYDVWAKTPLVGEAFVKFQGDLIRMIKNAAMNNPLHLAGFLATLKIISDLTSKASGETNEDYKTRTERFAAPTIPLPGGYNIPLTWQTPWGELDVARYISPFYANNDVSNIPSKMLPFVPSIDPKKDAATNIAQNITDPLLAPLAQLAINKDFRGKPISDPKENKYQPSTLTPEEQNTNKANFLLMGYTPPVVNSVANVVKTATTGQNLYNNPQTPAQAAFRLAGVKVSNMNPEEVQKVRERDAEFQQKGNESILTQIKSVEKQQLKGEITPEQAQNRIENLQGQLKNVNLQSNSKGAIQYIDDNGYMKTVDLNKVTSMPETTGYQRQLKQEAMFKILDDLQKANLDTNKLTSTLTQLGINKDQFDYYNVARQSDEAKTAWLQDKLTAIAQQGGTHADLIRALTQGRVQVGGKSIVSTGVLTNLYENGLITYQEKRALGQLNYDNSGGIRIKRSSGTGTKKAKKIKLSKPRKIGNSKFGKLKKFKFKTIKLKPISGRRLKFKLSKQPKIRAI